MDTKEASRLAALHDFHILGSLPEQGFDDIVELAAMVCGTRMAQITFVDEHRVWVKASTGLPPQEVLRSISFCTHTIASTEPLIVPDATKDPRFQHSPFVYQNPHIRCYAGAPIVDSAGHMLGALCVVNLEPCSLSDRQLSALQALARQVVTLLEQRRSMLLQERTSRSKLQKERKKVQQMAERLHLSQMAGKIASWDWSLQTDEVTWAGGTYWAYGRPASEISTKQQVFALIHEQDRDRVVSALQSVLDGAEEFRTEFRVCWPDGSMHWLLGIGQLVREEDGQPRCVVGINMDITERKLAEEKLLRSEKIATVGRLITSIAHEINNPMASVTNLLFLASVGESTAEVRELIALAQQELQRVSEIVNRTLRFHRQSSNPQPACAHDMIEGVMTMLQSRVSKASVQVEYRKRAQRDVVCFEGEIRQVIANLIGNAVDATPPGGRLLVRTRDGRHWPSDRSGLCLLVADTGHGMSAETLTHIFEAFFTTKGINGTGLGLWVTQDILGRHDGQLRVRSNETSGRSGTVMSVFLPHDGPNQFVASA